MQRPLIVLATVSAAAFIILLNQAAAQSPPAPSRAGRFVMCMHPTIRADQYLIDSDSGRVWQVQKSSTDDIIFQELRKYNLK